MNPSLELVFQILDLGAFYCFFHAGAVRNLEETLSTLRRCPAGFARAAILSPAQINVHFFARTLLLHLSRWDGRLHSVPVFIAGYRSVILKNGYSEELELASLLVHIEIMNAKVLHLLDCPNIYLAARGRTLPRSRHKTTPVQPYHALPLLRLQEDGNENLYTSIQRLRDRTSELSNTISLLESLGSRDFTYQQSVEELRVAQDQLSELVEARNRR